MDAEALKATVITDNQRFALMTVANQLENTERQIVDQGKHVRDKVRRALQTMEDGGTLNELGELQGSSSEFDRLISVRAQRLDCLAVLIGSLPSGIRGTVEKIVLG
jgi:hypothetical protein